jgi:hypothetical protein
MMKFVKLAAGFVALAFWFSSFFVWMHYAGRRNSTPDSLTGRVHELNTHGSVVYITSAEQHLIYGLMAGGVVFAVLTAVIHFSESRS